MHYQVIRRRTPTFFCVDVLLSYGARTQLLALKFLLWKRLGRMQLKIEMISSAQKEKNYILLNYHPTVTVDCTSSLCASASLLYAVL
jgi:hypothetical protein